MLIVMRRIFGCRGLLNGTVPFSWTNLDYSEEQHNFETKGCLSGGVSEMQKKTHDYDNVFKTMKMKHKRLFISVINDVFEKDYPLDVKVDVLSPRVI